MLFKLESPLKLGSYKGFIRPICLPQYDIDYSPIRSRFTEGKVIATGFGSLGYARGNSDNLQKVTLELYDQAKCNVTYSNNSKLPKGVDKPSKICAGSTEGKDTCGGDSGGPLQIYNTDDNIICMYTIVGLTSFGEQNCGVSPAIYTKVFYYLDWIEGIVWK